MFTLENVVDVVAKQNAWFLGYVQPESVRKELLNLNDRSAEFARTSIQQATEFCTAISQQIKKAAETSFGSFTASK